MNFIFTIALLVGIITVICPLRTQDSERLPHLFEATQQARGEAEFKHKGFYS